MGTNPAVLRIGTWNIEGEKSRSGTARGDRVAATLAGPTAMSSVEEGLVTPAVAREVHGVEVPSGNRAQVTPTPSIVEVRS